ncbi:ZBED5 protein, partial [Amia calva]|nr:ZBED5 protein [Amia calva]
MCCETLSNESMKPAHLRRHFTMKHAILKDEHVNFFRGNLEDLKQRKSTIRNSATPVPKAQETSYHASLRIAKAGKTVTRRIIDMVHDVRSTLIKHIMMSRCFSLQLDDFTDVSELSGVVAWIREIALDMKWTHCCIHRSEAMAFKKMPDLKSALDSAVKVVHFIKTRPMNSHLFSVLFNEMGSEHVQLLLHTEVRWQRLTRLFELHSEVQRFLHDQSICMTNLFDDPVWLVQLAYLADIFSCLNELNMGLQGEYPRICLGQEKLTSDDTFMSEFKLSLLNLFLMPFATTHLCEKDFSDLTAIKTKYCNKINAEPDLHLKLTALVPDIARLSSDKQAHPSQ